MTSVLLPIWALLSGLAILLIGNGLQAVLLGLRAGESFGESVTGIVMGGYFVGFVAGSFIIPALIRAVGYIRTFAAMAAVGSVTAVAYGKFVDPWVWFGLRVMSGLALVGIYMVVESWLNIQSASTNRGRVFGVYMIVTLLALAIGLLIAPLAGSSAQLEPYVLVSVLFTLGLIPVAVTTMPQPQSIVVPETGFRHLFIVSPVGFLGALLAGVVNGILWGLGPVFWRGLGLSEAEAAVYMALIIVGGTLLQWPIGRWSDGRDRRRVLAVVSLAAAGAVLLFDWAAASRPLLAACALAYGGLMLTLYSLSVAHVNDRVPPAEVLESTRTLLLLYGVGAAVGPVAAGPAMEFFGVSAFALLCASVLVSLALVAIREVLAKKPVAPEEQVAFVPLARTSQVAVEMLPDAEGIADDMPKDAADQPIAEESPRS
jgi:MFS family permease